MREIIWTNQAKKDLKKLTKETVAAIRGAVGGLACTPMVGQIKPLHGKLAGEYRLRVGNFRVIFSLTENTVTITSVNDRRNAYK